MTATRRRQAILAGLAAVAAAELAAGFDHHAGTPSHPDEPGPDTDRRPAVIAPAPIQPTKTKTETSHQSGDHSIGAVNS